MQSNEKNGRDFYALAWRWHFYAGLFVAPFMILLALTGIVYLFKPQLDALLYPQLLRVEAGAQMRSADQLLAGVRQAHPQAAVSQYLPPSEAGRSAQFVIGEEGRQWNLFVDPYSGRELGRQDAQLNLQAVARALHGELMVGTVGDRLIELAAGWGIVLVVSGLYLWWPRGRAASALFWPRLHLRGRPLWRDLHVVAGFWGSLLLLFMLLSGMTWTGYWGKQFADVWNRFPAAMWNDVPTSDMQAGSLNSASRQQVPWPLENTPLPRSQPPAADAHAEHRGHSAQAGHAMPMDMPMPAGILCKGWWISPASAAWRRATGSPCRAGWRGSTRFPCSPTIRATTPPCTSTSTAARFSPACVGRTTTRWRGACRWASCCTKASSSAWATSC